MNNYDTLSEGDKSVMYERLNADLGKALNVAVFPQKIVWHAGSLHVYERHFKYLEE